MSGTLFVFHGHFYQPPRENPWTGLVARETSAAPFHDWNARIDDECYRPNGYGRIVDDRNRIAEIVNNYAHMSFNVGPTLLAWLREQDPVTLQRIVEADRQSGGAIAQAYNHIILPLADARDRVTQIRWGQSVFHHHFGRPAQAMWLPETAASHAVLDDLIDHELRFVILAPHQAQRVRPLTGGPWKKTKDAGVDTSLPCVYRHRDGSGRQLLVFFYDGALAHEISFGDALAGTEHFLAHADRAAGRRGKGPLVHAATDGETAGHHNAWGDRVLAHALTNALPKSGATVTHYGHLLDRLEPRLEVELDHGPDGEGTAWSCAHGVGRWIRDCGCRIGNEPGSSQAWRAGLRQALDLLRDEARPWFEREAGQIFTDPWAARDAYIDVILEPTRSRREQLFAKHCRPGLAEPERARGLDLLELQHQLLLQYTSCGWFFDDIAGLEGRQVLRYAARAMEIWRGLGGEPPLDAFLAKLATATSNDPRIGDGARLFREILDRDAVGIAGVLVLSLRNAVVTERDSGTTGCWSWACSGQLAWVHDGLGCHAARVKVVRTPTGETHEATVLLQTRGPEPHRAWIRPGENPANASRKLQADPGAWLELGTPDFEVDRHLNDGGQEYLHDLETPESLTEEDEASVLRHRLEGAVERAILAGKPVEALHALAAAADLEIPLYLHRAQEAWFDRAASLQDRSAACELGIALGFAPALCESLLKGPCVDVPGAKGIRP